MASGFLDDDNIDGAFPVVVSTLGGPVNVDDDTSLVNTRPPSAFDDDDDASTSIASPAAPTSAL